MANPSLKLPKDSLKCIQDAWFKMLIDFRAYYFPETEQTAEWKLRDLKLAIKACPSRMMDDAETMLAEYRKSPNSDKVGATAFLPILLTASAYIDQPPEVYQLLPMPYFVDVPIDGKQVKMRVTGKTVRTQFAFFATNPHDAKSICDEFCAYMQDDIKRRLNVKFDLWNGIIEESTFTVLENQLFPSPVATDSQNLSVFTVDVQLIGNVPVVIGLGGPFDTNTGNGFNPDGSAKQESPDGKVVIEADQHSEEGHVHITADPANRGNH